MFILGNLLRNSLKRPLLTIELVISAVVVVVAIYGANVPDVAAEVILVDDDHLKTAAFGILAESRFKAKVKVGSHFLISLSGCFISYTIILTPTLNLSIHKIANNSFLSIFFVCHPPSAIISTGNICHFSVLEKRIATVEEKKSKRGRPVNPETAQRRKISPIYFRPDPKVRVILKRMAKENKQSLSRCVEWLIEQMFREQGLLD